ncbi:hypothetical protein BBI01_14605 [Chryseobacterium artocarpi]|uniref:2TM domain-containing protein n=1 Tax=Chryseobacterium artocarpi TaxID=1414727 RepID=A0A1B8ZCW4_9FLAO|nr:2TM domain-containing protein [Chryseobacterium artocarpi]OCA69376.1 hypothetical protein BBI01_14605 [Chryseobacterium artocarpi]
MNYNNTNNRVQQLKKFYKNLMWFGIITGIVIGNDLIREGFHYNVLSGHFILTVWALILVVKAISLFVFNDEWERKIIEKEEDKNKKMIDL